jgi:rRNA maturation RNase YbeY
VPVSFHTEKLQFELVQKIKHKYWIKQCIESHGKKLGDIAIVFTSNEQLRLMNQNYLNHNYFTDVITFDYSDEYTVSGDVFISVDQVKLNAEFYKTETMQELRRVMIHGVLHLIGFSDTTQDEKSLMREMENEALHLWLK